MKGLIETVQARGQAAKTLYESLENEKGIKLLQTPEGVPPQCAAQSLWVGCKKVLHEEKFYMLLKQALREEIIGVLDEPVLDELTKKIFHRLLAEPKKEH